MFQNSSLVVYVLMFFVFIFFVGILVREKLILSIEYFVVFVFVLKGFDFFFRVSILSVLIFSVFMFFVWLFFFLMGFLFCQDVQVFVQLSYVQLSVMVFLMVYDDFLYIVFFVVYVYVQV